MSAGHKAGCHAAVKDFILRHTKADEFLTRFDQLWHVDEELDADRDLKSIRELCEAYSRTLPPDSGCRISEEQFRLEIHALASRAERAASVAQRSTSVAKRPD